MAMDDRSLANTPVSGSQTPVPGSQNPVSQPGYYQSTNSGQDQQADQQQMNTQAQAQAATPVQSRPTNQTIMVGGKEVPYYPAWPGHASSTMTRLAQRAREQERTQANVEMPMSATFDGLLNARLMPMPSGGVHALAHQLYPDDVEDQEKMDNHIYDIMTLNRDTLRDDTSYPANAVVRVPGL
jgi:hypothetical protein